MQQQDASAFKASPDRAFSDAVGCGAARRGRHVRPMQCASSSNQLRELSEYKGGGLTLRTANMQKCIDGLVSGFVGNWVRSNPVGIPVQDDQMYRSPSRPLSDSRKTTWSAVMLRPKRKSAGSGGADGRRRAGVVDILACWHEGQNGFIKRWDMR